MKTDIAHVFWESLLENINEMTGYNLTYDLLVTLFGYGKAEIPQADMIIHLLMAAGISNGNFWGEWLMEVWEL